MGWFGSLRTGDWVRTTDTIPVTLSDHLGGGGIRTGTRGVVTGVHGSRATVVFDSGWGVHTATVRAAKLRRIRSGGGVDRFRRRARTAALVRLGLAIALLFPVLSFAAVYLWTYRTVDGIVPTLLSATLDGVGDWLSAAIAHPMQRVIFSVVVGLVGRWVFRR